MSDAAKTHDRYEWQVQVVDVEQAQETLNGITLGTWEVYSILPHGEKRLTIIARQHESVTTAQRQARAAGAAAEAQRRANPAYEDYPRGLTPFAGTYSSECGHVTERRFDRGVNIGACTVCRKQVRWALIDIEKPIPPKADA